MTSTIWNNILAAEGDGILDQVGDTFSELDALIPTALRLAGLALVLIVIFLTKSAIKSISAALAVAIMLTLTGNMPVLSELFGNELGAPASPSQPGPPPPPTTIQ